MSLKINKASYLIRKVRVHVSIVLKINVERFPFLKMSLVQDGVLVMVQLTHTTMPAGMLLVLVELVDTKMIP